MRPGAGVLLLEPPEQRNARAAPVLEVDCSNVVDAPELPGLAELMRQRHRRNPAIVVPDEGFALLGLARGIAHLPGVGERARQRLFASDVLSSSQRRGGLLGMEGVRSADIDQPYCGIAHRIFPVSGRVLPAPAIPKFFK